MKNLTQDQPHERALRAKIPLRVAVAGLGAIGFAVAQALDRGIPGCVLAAVSANDRGKAAERLSHLSGAFDVVGAR